MLIGDLRDDLPVHLFRPRLLNVAASKACLDVRNRNAAIIGGERADHGAGRVALHDDPIWPSAVVDFADRQQKPRAQLVQRLIGSHDVEIEIRLDPGQGENRIKEIAMLRGHADRGAEIFLRIEFVNDGIELQRLRARSNDHKDIFLHQWMSSVRPLRPAGKPALRKHDAAHLAIGLARFRPGPARSVVRSGQFELRACSRPSN